jgi:hypothetical protein
MFDDKYLDCFDDENEILMDDAFDDIFVNDSDIDEPASTINNSMKMRPAWQRIEEYIEMRELRSQLNDPGFHF